MKPQTENDAICCPPFVPEKWDDKLFEWENQKFLKDRVFTLFYIPMNYGAAMRRLDRKVSEAGAQMPEGLCLADHTSMWNMDLYLAVDREVPGGDNTTMSGKYFCKVYEGPYKDSAKWMKEFRDHAKEKGYTAKKPLLWYTTCPKCVKKYGKNYSAIFSEVE